MPCGAFNFNFCKNITTSQNYLTFPRVNHFSNKCSSTISIRSQHWIWCWEDKKNSWRGGGIYYGWCHSSEAWRCKNQAPVLEGLMKSSKNWAIIKRLLQYADIRPKSDTTSSSNYWYKSNKPSTTVSLKKSCSNFWFAWDCSLLLIPKSLSLAACLFLWPFFKCIKF